MPIEHGGTDHGPQIRSDFSTNAHPLGPNPFVLAAVRRADRSRYPDPSYVSLRQRLGELHRVSHERIVVGGSASELIWRLCLAWRESGGATVVAAETSFGEYPRAARALNLRVAADRGAAGLHFICDPDNPSGNSLDMPAEWRADLQALSSPLVVDLAYHPFRAILAGPVEAVLDPVSTDWADTVIQIWSPNKLHGLTGVRAAYLVLPVTVSRTLHAEVLRSLAPSWIVAAEGVALLMAHANPLARNFLLENAAKLRSWKERCERLLEDAGWERQSSPLHFGLYRPPVAFTRQRRWFEVLRAQGIKVRDASSFGRPGWVRLAARSAAEVTRLITLTHEFRRAG
jgi:histidinol-phosphate aminotransferase